MAAPEASCGLNSEIIMNIVLQERLEILPKSECCRIVVRTIVVSRTADSRGMWLTYIVFKLLWYLRSGNSHAGYLHNYDGNPVHSMVYFACRIYIDFYRFLEKGVEKRLTWVWRQNFWWMKNLPRMRRSLISRKSRWMRNNMMMDDEIWVTGNIEIERIDRIKNNPPKLS